MATVNFYLKDKNLNTVTPVNLIFSYRKEKPFKYATGISIKPSDWNFKSQRSKGGRSNKDSFEHNVFLDRVESLIKTIYARLLSYGVIVDNAQLKNDMDIELGRKKEKKSMVFYDYLTHIVEEKKELNSTDKYIVKMAADNVKGYFKSIGDRLDFDQINLPFRNQFNAYLDQQGYKQNSKHTCFAALRIILNQAQQDGHNPFNFFRDKKFGAKSEKVRKHSFSEEELIKIHNTDLSSLRPIYDNVRDIFLIGAFTALRVSDYKDIGDDNILGDMIHKKTQKTGANVVIPVHWVIKEILAKREGKLPPTHPRVTINIYIKKVAEMAKLDSPVTVSYTQSGKKITEVKKKHEVTSTHWARRSGIRNMQKAGIPKDKIMIFTGHKTESSFNEYTENNEEQNALELTNHEFFKKPEVKEDITTPQI